MPVSFNTFNKFPCLRIDLSKRIYCITLSSASCSHLSIILCHTSDKSMVIFVLSRIWNIVLIVQVIHSPLSSKMILLETSIHSGIHLDILLVSHESSRLVILTLIIRLCCSCGNSWLWDRSSDHFFVHHRLALLMISNLIVNLGRRCVSVNHIYL